MGFVTTTQAQVFHPQTAQLDNGLQIVVLPNAVAPVITQMLWIKAGSADDPWGHSGAAHFMEHLMFKGTKKHPNDEYSKIISHLGGTQNAFTTTDYTAYYATFAKQHLPIIMALEADRLANWQVTDAQVASERDVILKERQQRIDNDPMARFWEQVDATLYINHPYQRPPIGWQNEMVGLDRTVVTAFQQRYYTASNIILVLSGDVTLDGVLPLVKQNFGALPRAILPPRIDTQVPPSPAYQTLRMTSKLVQQPIWSRHYLVAPARPATIVQSDALLVLTKILGDARIGRLYRRLVVNDKIATSATINFDPQALGPARWSIIVTPQPHMAMKKIAAAVDNEIARLLRDGVTDDELKHAVQSLNIETIYARDSVSAPAMIMGAALASGLDVQTVEAWPTRLRAITKQHILTAAETLLQSQKPLTAILQPERK